MKVLELIDKIPNDEFFHLCNEDGKIVYIGSWVKWLQNVNIWRETKDKEIELVTVVNDTKNNNPVIRISMQSERSKG